MSKEVSEKTCSKCGDVLPATSEFFKVEKRFAVGFAAECRKCRAKRERERYAAEPDKHNKSCKSWRRKNPAKIKEGNKRAKLKIRYGLSPDEYGAMLKSQGQKCAICGETGGGRWGVLVVDHDHKTDEVRGLLCHNCNTAIGLMNDAPDRLRKAAEYLVWHKGEESSGSGRKTGTKLASVKQEVEV